MIVPDGHSSEMGRWFLRGGVYSRGVTLMARVGRNRYEGWKKSKGSVVVRPWETIGYLNEAC
jgi:hypothetical protein